MNNDTDTEFERFNKSMDRILKADPEAVKKAMQEDKLERATRRESKKSSSSHVSGDKH